MPQHVLIVGAGIIGASVAFELSKRGVNVTIVDSGRNSATEASFGWINANYFTDARYFKLRLAGIQAHRALADELELPINWQGCLCWEEAGEALVAQAAQLTDLGYDAEIVNSDEISRLEPNLSQLPEKALLFHTEAAAESSQLTQALLKASRAQLISGVEVEGFHTEGDRVIGLRSSAGDLFVDEVLVCAGTGTQPLMKMVDLHLPMLRRPGLMVTTKPVEPLLNHILAAPDQEFRQLPNGSILAPAAASHQSDDTEEVAEPIAMANIAIARLNRLISGVDLELSEARMAFRPVPEDGFPAVGRVQDGLYVATMHSGMTLAAIMGNLIASEIADGVTNLSNDLLSSYRPNRFR